jgi:hypothetical protein
MLFSALENNNFYLILKNFELPFNERIIRDVPTKNCQKIKQTWRNRNSRLPI